jgi:tRNA A37 threonylcarbamoyladenosine biosynthesis protein TsaE
MEFASLQPEEFLRDPHSLVVLEWPEKVEGQLPKADVILNFSSDEALPGERFINIEPRPEDGPNRKG